MNNYEKSKQLESIGLPVHAGCRCELVETVMEQYGMPIAEIIREHYEMDRNPSDSEIQAEITNLNRRWVEQTLDSRCQHLKARLEVAGVNVERGEG